MNQHIIDNLDFYTELDDPQYAILLNGEWGCGKTHFIDEYIRNNSNKFIKVSFFGMDDLSEIDEMVFYQLHPKLNSKYVKLAGGIIKTAVKVGLRLDLDNNGKEETTVKADFDKMGVFNDVKDLKKEYIFVFDDLERATIDLSVLLGYINYLVEQSGFRVIIIANESIIDDDNYKKFKEKVVGNTFEVQHNFETTLSSLLENRSVENNTLLRDSNELLKKYSAIIEEINTKSQNKNLRIIKQTMDDFAFLYGNIDKEYWDNEKFAKLLISQFFYITINFKKGENIDSIMKDMNSNLESYRLFSSDIWSKILVSKTANREAIKSILDNLTIFKSKSEQPDWVKLWRYSELEEEDFNTILYKVIKKLKNMEFSKPEEFLHVIGLLIDLNDKGLSEVSIDELELIAKKTMENEKIEMTSGYHNDSMFNGTGLCYYSTKNDFFRQTIEEINEYNTEITIKKEMDIIKKNMDVVYDSILKNQYEDNFYEILRNYADKPIFQFADTDKLIEVMSKASNKSLREFGGYLDSRYGEGSMLNGKYYYNYLKEEVVFWQDLEAKLTSLIKSTEERIKKYNLKTVLGLVIRIISKLKS